MMIAGFTGSRVLAFGRHCRQVDLSGRKSTVIKNAIRKPLSPSSTRKQRFFAAQAMASSQGATSQNGDMLLQTAGHMEQMLSQRSLEVLDQVADSNVTLHQDAVTLQTDLKGLQSVKDYYKSYFDQYTYTHVPLVTAANINTNSVFSFGIEKDVQPSKVGAAQEAGAAGEEASKPSTTAGIWKHVVNPSTGKVTDIYFMRQMSNDERYRKLKDPKILNETAYGFNGPYLEETYKAGVPSHNPDRTAMLAKAADKFSTIWRTGDPSCADEIMAPDVRDIDMMFGSETRGVDGFKSVIKGVFEKWESESAIHDIAVSPDNMKAFIHWSNYGKQLKSGAENNLKGMNVLLFDDDGRIKEILGFRQPLATQREHLFK